MITAGLVFLAKSQTELSELGRFHRTDDLVDPLKDWVEKTRELTDRVIEHHLSCLAKVMAMPKFEG
jgi:hypothetical protein